MKYPKPFMETGELIALGLPRCCLYEIAHTPGQKCCIRKTGSPKSHFIFDTEKLDKELAKRYSR